MTKEYEEELYSIIIDTNQNEVTLDELEKVLIELSTDVREEPYIIGEYVKDISEIGFYNFIVEESIENAKEMIDSLQKHHIKAKILTDPELDAFWDERDDMRNDEETIKIVFKDQTLPIKLFPVTEEEAQE